MGVQDTVNYIVYTNPVSANAIHLTKKTLSTIFQSKSNEIPIQTTIISERVPLYKLAQEGGPFVRIAGLMGATAVALGAYGAHRSYPKDLPKEKQTELQRIFETGNRYHFINSLALLCVPLCRCPKISGSLLIMGITLFSGTCYYHAITGQNKFGQLAPVGGTCLILGWLAMVM